MPWAMRWPNFGAGGIAVAEMDGVGVADSSAKSATSRSIDSAHEALALADGQILEGVDGVGARPGIG